MKSNQKHLILEDLGILTPALGWSLAPVTAGFKSPQIRGNRAENYARESQGNNRARTVSEMGA